MGQKSDSTPGGTDAPNQLFLKGVGFCSFIYIYIYIFFFSLSLSSSFLSLRTGSVLCLPDLNITPSNNCFIFFKCFFTLPSKINVMSKLVSVKSDKPLN